MNRRERRRQQKLEQAQRRPAAAPGVADLRRRATANYQAGRLEDALRDSRAILAAQPDSPDALAFAGMIALKLGDAAEAARLYERSVGLRPDHAEAHYNLGNAFKKLDRFDDAAAAYRRAAELRPDLAPVHHNLGSVLQSLERFEEAAGSYGRALEHAPDSAETHRNLGLALQRLERYEDAAASLRRAIELRPGWLVAYSGLAHLLLEAGDAAGTLAACDAWLGHSPGNTEALALKCVALNEAGDRRALGELLDFDRFVKVLHHEPPDGYADLAEFNAALAAHVRAHPTLRVPPTDHPTYHHPKLHITAELLAEPKGPVAHLERMMREAIDGYRRSHLDGSDHPFVANWPARWRLTSWATLLEGQGNLVSHIHLDGYLGGVYYVEMPDVVAAPDQGEAGWFELGRPPDVMAARAEPVVRRVRPEPGRMLLFPGYFYHRTVPFDTGQQRISIAFDLVAEG